MNPALAKQIVLPSKLVQIFKKIVLAQDCSKVVLVPRDRHVDRLEVERLIEDMLTRMHEEVELFLNKEVAVTVDEFKLNRRRNIDSDFTWRGHLSISSPKASGKPEGDRDRLMVP